MSPNPYGAVGAMPHAGTRLSAFDVGHSYTRDVNGNTPSQKDHFHQQKQSIKAGTQDITEGQASSENNAGAAEDGDADDGDGNSDEVDKDSSNAEDPDVKAPSECAAGVGGHQTGSNFTDEGSHVTMKISEDRYQAGAHENSDDEGYDDLDLISDAEKEGSEMDYLEERVIVESEEDGPQRTYPGATTEGSPAMDEQLGEPSDFEEKFNRTILDGTDGDAFGAIPSDFTVAHDCYLLSSPTLAPQRRVRFAEPPHSEIGGSGSYLNQGMFRDQDRAPTFSSISDLEIHSDGSSGYETDYGDTTDEDEIPGSATARPQALMRQPPTSSNKTSSSGAPPLGPKTNIRRGGPKMASWFVDPTKAVALVDSRTKKLLVFPALRPTKPDGVFAHLTGSGSSTANASPRTASSQLTNAPIGSDIDHSDFSSQGIVSPMLAPPNALETVFSRSEFATTGLYADEYAAASSAYYASLIGDDDVDDFDDADDIDDFEKGITMSDLVHYDSDDEEEEESRPSSSASDFDELLHASQSSRNFMDHLDPGLVTAFRDNQHRVEEDQPEMFQPHSPLRKRKASPPLHAATRRRIAT